MSSIECDVHKRLGLGKIELMNPNQRFDFGPLYSLFFDNLHPRIARHGNRDEVVALMEVAGLTSIEIGWVNEVSWAAIGTRPDT